MLQIFVFVCDFSSSELHNNTDLVGTSSIYLPEVRGL